MSNLENSAQAGYTAEQAKVKRAFDQTEFDPERNEEHAKLLVAAKNMLDCFGWRPGEESFLVVTDTKVMKENPDIIHALEQELKERAKQAGERGPEPGAEYPGAGHYRIRVVKASPKSATPFEWDEGLRDQPVLIITSMSRSHSPETGIALRGDVREEHLKHRDELLARKSYEPGETGKAIETEPTMWEKFIEMLRERRSRIISVTKGHNPYEILTKGAALESTANLRERADKMRDLMKDVTMAHITTPLGTDLWLAVRPDLEEVEDGRVDQPGKCSNFPIGEWSCSPDWQGSSGVLVVDGPCGGNINQDILDEGRPLRLTIENGQVVKMEGGEEALTMLRRYLDSGNNKKNDAYRLAELGIGINASALKDKPRPDWGSSEGEKKYGTCHVAVGSNGTFGRKPDDPNFNAAQVHCDMVLGLNPGGEVTVECVKKDGSSFKLIENGQSQGY